LDPDFAGRRSSQPVTAAGGPPWIIAIHAKGANVQSIDVLVIGSGEGRDGGLALRLARLGHRVVWAEAGELTGIPDPLLWDVVAVDDSDDSVAPEDLIVGLGRWDAPLMVVGADPLRAAGA
jgi:hypothetical protein